MNENEVKSLMRTDAYNDKFNPDYDETQKIVKQAFKNLYPEDDRNESPKGYYVWRCVGDERTRSEHEERDGEVFSWDEPPEGGHPGEDFGCRCLALPYKPVVSEEKAQAKVQEEIDEIRALIDYKNGMLPIYDQAIKDIEDRLSEISLDILSTGKQGFYDGMQAADDSAGNMAKIVGTLTKTPLIEGVNLLVGGLSGGMGVANEKVKDTKREKEYLMERKSDLLKLITETQSEVSNLEVKIKRLEVGL